MVVSKGLVGLVNFTKAKEEGEKEEKNVRAPHLIGQQQQLHFLYF